MASLLSLVRDDGTGTGASADSGRGYGLRALKERLEAVYGNAASLSIRNEGSGFEVSISMPCHPASADSGDEP